MTASGPLLLHPIPCTREAIRDRLPAPTNLDAAIADTHGYVLAGTAYEVDPANRKWGDGRRFFSDAFLAMTNVRADGSGPGRVDRIQAVLSNFFTPGTGFIACLVSSRSFLRAIWDEQEYQEGPLVIGIHSFHYATGNADWSGELGTLRLPRHRPLQKMQVWLGNEEKGFETVYGQDLDGFAAGMGMSTS